MKKIFKKKKLIFSLSILLAIILIIIYYLGKEEVIEYNFTLTEKQDLVQEISATGRIKAVDEINLAFEKGGKIKISNIEIGDKVEKGQILISLESNDILAEISQARAGVSSAKARLNQYEAALEKERSELEILKIGTRDEEILIYESKVQNAEAIYDASIQNITSSISDAYTKSDDSIRNKIDVMFNNPRGTNPQLIFNVNDSQLETNIEWGRSLIEQQLVSWANIIKSLEIDQIPDETIVAEDRLGQIQSFLGDIALAVNNLFANTEFTQTVINSYKTNIYTARTNVNTAITNLSSYKEKFNTSRTSLTITENELSLKKAANTPEKINSQEAIIKQAEANIASQKAEIELKESMVQSALVRLSKDTLKSPISGTIITKEAEIGSIVSAGKIVISVISEDNLEIESNIVEADIAYLKIGDQAKLSLDAYNEEDVFEAEVVQIDPAAKLIDGVANYKITLNFKNFDERIKSGMTADIDIITMELKNVIVIPYRAIIFRNGSGKFVKLLKEGNQAEEVSVETGLIGNGNLIEIKTGINVGDKVITSTKNNN